MPPARVPMSWVASRMKKAVPRRESARMTREQMMYEVSAAAKPPQTTPLHTGISVDTREGNGEYRRRRAVVPLPCFLSHLSHVDGPRFFSFNWRPRESLALAREA